MDETVRPLRIPVAMATYGDTHQLSHLMQELVSNLLLHRPDDPISFLIQMLSCRTDIPRVLLLGPPAVGKTTVAERLKTDLMAVHVTTPSLLENQSQHSTLNQQEPPDKLIVKLLHQRLNKSDCISRGWILDGFPRTRLQALSLQQAGIVPRHVVLLEAPGVDVLQQRSEGRMFDPVTGNVYHRTYIWPNDDVVAGRLESGRSLCEDELQQHCREVTGLNSAYQHVMKVFNGDQPPEEVYRQVLSFVQTRHCSRTPRILLFGPPGSGKSHQARRLSEKYSLVDVCCGQLLRCVAAGGSKLGKQIQTFLDDGQAVPDSMVLQVVEDRLSGVDCSVRGWILHGFPRDLQQAQRLKERPLQVNRVFFLEVTDEDCLERISRRATDPVSGQRYHPVTPPVRSPEVKNRLRSRPEDNMEAVRQSLRHYRDVAEVLQSLYPDAVHIKADQDPHSVFESLESRLTTN